MNGVQMQQALLTCRVVYEEVRTEAGPVRWYCLDLDGRLLSVGADREFAESLQFAIRRNAEAFEGPKPDATNVTWTASGAAE